MRGHQREPGRKPEVFYTRRAGAKCLVRVVPAARPSAAARAAAGEAAAAATPPPPTCCDTPRVARAAPEARVNCAHYRVQLEPAEARVRRGRFSLVLEVVASALRHARVSSPCATRRCHASKHRQAAARAQSARCGLARVGTACRWPAASGSASAQRVVAVGTPLSSGQSSSAALCSVCQGFGNAARTGLTRFSRTSPCCHQVHTVVTPRCHHAVTTLSPQKHVKWHFKRPLQYNTRQCALQEPLECNAAVLHFAVLHSRGT